MDMSWKCVNNPDNFCHICGEVTFASRKCSITPTTKKAYFLDFGCKKMGTTRVVQYVFIQTQCVGEWKRTFFPFGVPVVWRVPRNHSTDCYFSMVPPIQNGMSMKKKSTLVYPNTPSANDLCLMAMDPSFKRCRQLAKHRLLQS